MVNTSFKVVFLATLALSIYGFTLVTAVREANNEKSAPTIVAGVKTSTKYIVIKPCTYLEDCYHFCPPGEIPFCHNSYCVCSKH
ncbi:hypothetical protein Hanom_Chr04g00326231 [Helianthus anomalus]